MSTFSKMNLRAWQTDFARSYLSDRKPRSILFAQQGTGKTLTALYTGSEMLERGFSEFILVLSDRQILKEQWQHVGSSFTIEFVDALPVFTGFHNKACSLTIQSITHEQELSLVAAAMTTNFFIIVDLRQSSEKTDSLTRRLSAVNKETRTLYVSDRAYVSKEPFDGEYSFNTEYIFNDSLAHIPELKSEVSLFSPSYSILDKLFARKTNLDDLTWKEFEHLIAKLLSQEGYTVKEMRGTKDGGVDVLAHKDLGIAGSFMAVWQAKKKHVKNKVGLSVIRELADTTREWKATKGMLVTTTFLTKGALDRIQRDNYTLGKIDRSDLEKWIDKIFFEKYGRGK